MNYKIHWYGLFRYPEMKEHLKARIIELHQTASRWTAYAAQSAAAGATESELRRLCAEWHAAEEELVKYRKSLLDSISHFNVTRRDCLLTARFGYDINL